MKRYVLTSGPCGGKTTIINILKERGYEVLPELARELIEKEIASGGDLVPWVRPQEFERLIAWKQLWRELFFKRSDVLFLDRGIIDTVGYCVLEKVKIPKIVKCFGKNRYDKVFLLDLIPVHKVDESRKENREFAENVHEEIRKAYISYGYEVISVPIMTPEERVKFILQQIGV